MIIEDLFPQEVNNFVKIPFSKYSYPIAIILAEEKANSQSVTDAYRKGLEIIIENRTYQKILKKYYKYDIDFDQWFKDMKRFKELYKMQERE